MKLYHVQYLQEIHYFVEAECEEDAFEQIIDHQCSGGREPDLDVGRTDCWYDVLSVKDIEDTDEERELL